MRIAKALLIVALPQVFGLPLPLPLHARQSFIATLLGLLGFSGSSSGGLGDVTGALSGTSTSGLTSGATSGLVSGLTGASSGETTRIKARQNFIASLLNHRGINLGGASTSDLGAFAGAGTTGLVDGVAGAATSLSSGGTGLAGAARDTNAVRGLLDSIDGKNPVNDLLAPAEGIASVADGTEGLQFINPLLSAVEGASTLLTLGGTSAPTVASRDTATKPKRQSDGLGNLAGLLNLSTLLATLGGIPGLGGLAGLLSGLGSSGSSGS